MPQLSPGPLEQSPQSFENADDLVVAEVQALVARAAKARHSELWRRVEELHAATQISHVLHLDQLEENDLLILALTRFDHINNSRQTRKIVGRLVRPILGLLEVGNDSWTLGSEADRARALIGGQAILLSSIEPTRKAEGPLPCLVHSEPLNLQTPDGTMLPGSDLRVNWVNLGEFYNSRILGPPF